MMIKKRVTFSETVIREIDVEIEADGLSPAAINAIVVRDASAKAGFGSTPNVLSIEDIGVSSSNPKREAEPQQIMERDDRGF